MIISSKINIIGNSKNLKYYREKGYDISINQEIEVNVIDLSKGSTFKVLVECDICHTQKYIEWSSYYKHTKAFTELYYCSSCNIIKRKETNIKKYGGNSPTCDPEIVKKIEQTNLKKWGAKCTLQSPDISESVKNKFLEKFGVENPFQSKIVLDKCKKTLIENWGVDVPLKSKELLDKLKQTNIEKYGHDNIFKLEQVKRDIILNQIEKYGDLYVRTDEFKDKSKSTSLKKWGNEFFGRSKEYIERIIKNKSSSYNIDIKSYDFENKTYKIKCGKCHNISDLKSDIIYSRAKSEVDICTTCNPIGDKYTSSHEKKILEFLRENGVLCETTNMSVIHPYHLDICSHEHKIAIEFNGLWWHNEFFKNRNYHINKYNNCIKAGFDLIQIWEDDWNLKKDIVKSILLNKFGKTKDKIYARKCKLATVDFKTKEIFLSKNHIQGNAKSFINIGLFLDEELVSLMTFSKRNINGKVEFEIVRFCNKLNTSVIGGASKIFQYFLKNYNYDEIISYSDNTISNGNLYQKLGFKYTNTSINYYWCDGKMKYHRFNFNKKRLIKLGYDESKTENEIMHERKFYKIWGAGNKRWVYNNANLT
jgi:hypothetical protein